MRKVLTTVVGMMPANRIKNRLLNMLGHDVAGSASIAPVIILGTTRLRVGEFSRLGPFNVFRNVKIDIEAHSELGQWNWVSAAPFLVAVSPSECAGTFSMGAHSSVTSRHYFDASGGIQIAEFVTVAGVRSVFMTHGIDVADNVLDTAPIVLAKFTMIGGSCNFVLGARVPAYSVVAMGSVVVKGLNEEHALYAGVPACFKKQVAIGDYMVRTVGAVPPRQPAAETNRPLVDEAK